MSSKEKERLLLALGVVSGRLEMQKLSTNDFMLLEPTGYFSEYDFKQMVEHIVFDAITKKETVSGI